MFTSLTTSEMQLVTDPQVLIVKNGIIKKDTLLFMVEIRMLVSASDVCPKMLNDEFEHKGIVKFTNETYTWHPVKAYHIKCFHVNKMPVKQTIVFDPPCKNPGQHNL